MRHPEVYGIDDAGGIMFGRIGKEILGIVFFLCKLSVPELQIDRANEEFTQTGSSWQAQPS